LETIVTIGGEVADFILNIVLSSADMVTEGIKYFNINSINFPHYSTFDEGELNMPGKHYCIGTETLLSLYDIEN